MCPAPLSSPPISVPETLSITPALLIEPLLSIVPLFVNVPLLVIVPLFSISLPSGTVKDAPSLIVMFTPSGIVIFSSNTTSSLIIMSTLLSTFEVLSSIACSNDPKLILFEFSSLFHKVSDLIFSTLTNFSFSISNTTSFGITKSTSCGISSGASYVQIKFSKRVTLSPDFTLSKAVFKSE